jgi:hypothetical protein
LHIVQAKDSDGKTAADLASNAATQAAFSGGVADGEGTEDDPDDSAAVSSNGDEFGGFDDGSAEETSVVAGVADDNISDADDEDFEEDDDFGGFDDSSAKATPPPIATAAPAAVVTNQQSQPKKQIPKQQAPAQAYDNAQRVGSAISQQNQARLDADLRWWVGKQSKAAANFAVTHKTTVGQFLVRQSSQAMAAVIVVNDYGVPKNIQVQIKADGSATVTKKRCVSQRKASAFRICSRVQFQG